jgi:hypothetical protein
MELCSRTSPASSGPQVTASPGQQQQQLVSVTMQQHMLGRQQSGQSCCHLSAVLMWAWRSLAQMLFQTASGWLINLCHQSHTRHC